MLDPYRMVVVNVILLVTLTILVIGFKFVFPKKKLSYFLLLLLYASLPLISILRKGTYESGALSEYVKLTYNFYQNLITGVLLPQWAPFLCSLYGCPDFIYMYPLPYYIVSLFHTLGFSLIASVKLLLAATYLLSGIAMFYLAKEFMKEKYAFAAAILYLFAPYHLVNLHFQVDIAEMTSFVFIPLCFLFSYRLVTKNGFYNFYFLAGSISLLALSHPVISFVTLPFLIIFNFAVWLSTKKRDIYKLILLFLTLLTGLLLTSYYWGPAILESKFIYWGINAITTPLPLQAMLFSPWRFGFLFQGPIGQLSYFLGFAHWIIIAATGVFLYFNRKKVSSNIVLIYCFVSFLIIFIGIQEIAAPIWKFPFLRSFQMTSRLLVLIAFFTSLMGGLLLNKINRQSIWILICVIAIATTILNWGNRRPIPEIDDGYLVYEMKNKPPMSMDLTAPRWTKYNKNYFETIPKERMEILSGDGKIKTILHNPTEHQYLIDADTDLKLKENTFYYPGWTLYINGERSDFNFEDKKYPGTIVFNLYKGINYVEVKYEQTKVQKVFRFVSLAALVLLTSTLLFKILYRKKAL